jgi:hypothetical protein
MKSSLALELSEDQFWKKKVMIKTIARVTHLGVNWEKLRICL